MDEGLKFRLIGMVANKLTPAERARETFEKYTLPKLENPSDLAAIAYQGIWKFDEETDKEIPYKHMRINRVRRDGSSEFVDKSIDLEKLILDNKQDGDIVKELLGNQEKGYFLFLDNETDYDPRKGSYLTIANLALKSIEKAVHAGKAQQEADKDEMMLKEQNFKAAITYLTSDQQRMMRTSYDALMVPPTDGANMMSGQASYL